MVRLREELISVMVSAEPFAAVDFGNDISGQRITVMDYWLKSERTV